MLGRECGVKGLWSGFRVRGAGLVAARRQGHRIYTLETLIPSNPDPQTPNFKLKNPKSVLETTQEKRRWTCARTASHSGPRWPWHHTPYTTHSSPYTLHPAPHTTHHTPDTLHLTPYTRHPTPYTIERTLRTTERPTTLQQRRQRDSGCVHGQLLVLGCSGLSTMLRL